MLKDALSRMAVVFSPNVLMQGQEYQQKGYVLSARLSDGLLKARVKGRSGRIYDVHLDFKSWPATPARCSCQQGINCKHAAASLFSLQERDNLSIPPPQNQPEEASLASWLDSLRAELPKRPSPETSHQVIYLLEPQVAQHEHRVLVRLALGKRLKRGGFGQKVIFNTITPHRQQFFSEQDENIINLLLQKFGSNSWFDRFSVRNSELLENILSTNRAFLFEEDEAPQLSLGNLNQVQMHWQLNLDGSQHLVMERQGHPILPLFLDKPWYYDSVEHVLGNLSALYPLAPLKTLFELPPVTLDQASIITALMSDFPDTLPRPTVFTHSKFRRVLPKPVLLLDAVELHPGNEEEFQNEALTSHAYVFTLDIAFDYTGIRIHVDDPSQRMVYQEGETLVEIERDRTFEKSKQEECAHLLPTRAATIQEKLDSHQDLRHRHVLIHYHQEQDLVRLHQNLIPRLKNLGWAVELNHPVYDQVLTADDLEWFSEIRERGHDFFAYQLGILVDGKPVSIVPLVADLIVRLKEDTLDDLADDKLVYLPLPDGKRLQLTMARVKPLIRFLLHYGTRSIDEERQLQINRYQLLLMQETEQALAASSTRWLGGERLREQMKQLIGQKPVEVVAIPKGLKATLREYQHQGLNWLQFLRSSRFGGVLADDMGLGKTVQTLAHLQLEKEQARLTKASLIIAPTSLVGNWYEEAKRFTPELNILIFHGMERHQVEFDDYDVVISTYGLIQRDKTRFIEHSFYYLILDEAQFIKNARAKTTQIIQQIKASHRLCLSGTPLENHLGELWSLFHFLMPGLLGDAKQFRRFFKIPIEKNANRERRELLAKRVRPFMLRRTKNEVVRELPAKTETTQLIELSGVQRDLYEAIRMSMEKKVREAIARQGLGKSHIVLLDALLKLRQVCCDPRLLSIPEAQMAYGTSAKLDALMALLDNLVAENRRVLVFSQFTSMLKLIEEQLVLRSYGYLKLTGQTQNRQHLVTRFQEGDTPIFLISLKAGGTGLNLTRADTVIHYDPWWNPAAEDQATDRSHRIGQENPVFVYKLITAGTVEEAILAMQDKKRQLFDGILSDNLANLGTLTASDIEHFFAPLVDLP
jgi:superfamily II DNA or RNA helicase